MATKTNIPTVEAVVARLGRVQVPMKDVAAQAAVGERWLNKLRAGQIPEPGVKRFARVVAYLDKEKI